MTGAATADRAAPSPGPGAAPRDGPPGDQAREVAR